ncbi:S8 family serine peptidase [Deinococcus oregonensis]|uniref:S8 family serine peptidase n=1 Tax=Deinococcus oregonensis TaxID=1805970 RepID=A0ABV6B819_9DEIO
MTLRRTLPALTVLTFALLTACNTAPITDTSANNKGAPRFDYVATVPLESGDTPKDLSRTLGGTVLSWDNTDCGTADSEICVALMGMNIKNTVQGKASPQTAQLHAQGLEAQASRKVYIEPNKDVFSGGGSITATMGGSMGVWAGGSMGVWAGGSMGVWAGGIYAPLPQNTTLWQKIRLQQAHTLAPSLGAGVIVAVIDTGIDLKHPAFQGSLTAAASWRDFYANDAIPQEEGVLGIGGYGHGTNVAGIVLQIAPKAKIMPLRVLGQDGSGDVIMVAQAVDWAVANGAKIINMSLGSEDNSKVVQDAIDRAIGKGILVVSSAGNANLNKITYPATNADLKGTGNYAVSVGSVSLQDVKSTFSNYADTLEMVAPGENVAAPAPGGMLAAWSGTSMAAPMAAGGLALALGQTLSVPLSDLTQKMVGNAFDVYGISANQPYKDKLGDKGRLDLETFLKSAIVVK